MADSEDVPEISAGGSRDHPTAAGLRPEWADVGRLGRRLLRVAVTSARADEVPTPASVIADHLGPDAPSLPVVAEGWASYEQVNLQEAVDRWLARGGRTHTLLGLTDFQHHLFTLADLTQPTRDGYHPKIGAVAMTRLASGPSGATRACVRCGLYLVDDGPVRMVFLLREGEEHSAHDQATLEVLTAEPEHAAAVLAEIRDLSLRHSVFRGQVLSFAAEMFGRPDAPLMFHERPSLDRDALVLPPGVLEAVEAQVIGIARNRVRLLASGQHLKRGVLLHGAPGTGKTHTVRYLIGRLTDTTVVMLSGVALRYIGQAVSIARALQPALVVVEDVDLIAEHRGHSPGGNPLLFQLLNEMDGLGEDVDVTFLLTTNRPDLLEEALAQRPGRVDQAVELPLPDADGRLRLILLYRGNLELELTDAGPIVAGTEGMTAAFVKELLRRAALVAAEQDGAADDAGALVVTDTQVRTALDQLLDERNRLTRVLLGSQVDPVQPGLRAGPPEPGLYPG